MPGTPHTVSDVTTRTVVALSSVVSESDLLPKEEFRDGDPDRYARLRRLLDLAEAGARVAGELMTTPAATARADETLARAARTMARVNVERLPVLDADGVLQGIVSRSDLLEVFLRDDEDIPREVRRACRTSDLRPRPAATDAPPQRRWGDGSW